MVGGKDVAGRRLRSVEALDPREGVWRGASPLAEGRSSCGVACVGGQLFAMGGNDDSGGLLSTVEVYCPFRAAWHAAPPLPFACSGCAACPV